MRKTPGFAGRLSISSPSSGETPLEIICLGTRQEFISATANTPSNEAICAGIRSKARDGSDNANSAVFLVKFGGFVFSMLVISLGIWKINSSVRKI